MEHIIWNADPVMITIGRFSVYWYGVLFAAAIMGGFYAMKFIVYKKENLPIEELDYQLAYTAVGMIIGARIGHCMFYNPGYFLSNPLKILAIWEGGLASHGGGIGLLISLYIYHKRSGTSYYWLLDRLPFPATVLAFTIRIANFINSEIIGTPTDVPWAIIFQKIDSVPRHPVQLYEATAYASIFILLVIAYYFTDLVNRKGLFFGMSIFLTLFSRFIIEFFKVNQAAYDSGLLFSTGQMLSIPFILTGLIIIFISLTRKQNSN